MRRINLRLLAILAISVAILGVAVHLLHGYQIRANADAFLREAREARESGETGVALHRLEWYLRFVPDDVEAQAELGMMLADRGANHRAFALLEGVLRGEPDRMDVRRKLVDVIIRLGRHSDARTHLEDYLLKQSPGDPELLAILATCQQAMGDLDAAEASLRESIDNEPRQVDAYAQLARLLQTQQKRRAEADPWIERMLEANPESGPASLAAARYFRDTERYEAALPLAEAALGHAPDDLEALLTAATCALAATQFDKAARYAEKGVELAPKQPVFYSVLVETALSEGRRDAAVELLREAIKSVPGEATLTWRLADLLIDQGRLDEAAALLDRLREASYAESLVGYLRARIDFRRGRWLQAAQGFSLVRAELSSIPSLVINANCWLGRCYREIGSPEMELAAYRQAKKFAPRSVLVRSQLASALLAAGRLDEAVTEYRALMTFEDAPPSGWIDLARLLVHRAEDRQDWEQVDETIRRAAEALPGAGAVPVVRAEALIAQNRAEDAERVLSQAVERLPDEVDPRIALSVLAQRRQDWKRAGELLDEAESRFGPTAAVRLARARYLIGRHGAEAKDALRQLLSGTENLAEDELASLRAGLAAAFMQIGDHDAARELYLEVCEQKPNNLAVRLVLFDLAVRADDHSGIDELLDEIQRIAGRGPLWQYGRAVYLTLLARQGDTRLLDEALEILTDLQIRRPEWSRLALLAARIHSMRGDVDQAIEQYSRAIDLGERSPAAIRRAVALLHRRGRYVEADRFIRRLEEQRVDFTKDLGRVATDVSLRLDEFQRALEIARQTAADSDDYQDRIWLAQVLSVVGLRARSEGRTADAQTTLAEAEAALRKAVEQAPAEPLPWLALVRFYARTDQSDKAEETLASAEEKLPSDEAPLALAQCCELLGRTEEAEQRYREALRRDPKDMTALRQAVRFFLRAGKADQSEALLEGLVSQGETGAQEDAAWARRSLATMLLVRGGYANVQRALELVDANLEAAQAPSVRDRRLKALVLASHPTRKHRREAAETLEELVADDRTVTSQERFILAKLYLGSGNWTAYRQQMQRVLAAEGDQPRYVAAYVRVLLSRKETAEALLWLKKLDQLAPDQLSTVALKAEAAFQRKRYDDALELIRGYPEKSNDDSPERLARLGLAAVQAESFTQKARAAGDDAVADRFLVVAEDILREFAAQRPQGDLILVPFLTRHGRLDEALQAAEKHWENGSPIVLAESLTALLRASMNDPARLQRVESLLASAAEKHDRAAPLLLVMADLASFQQRYAQAEEIYREILQKHKSSTLAMNNLAMLLAVRKRNLPEAVELVNEAISHAGPTAVLLDTRAMIHSAQGQTEAALADLEIAMAESPSAEMHFHQAIVHHRAGQTGPAREALKRALEAGLKAEHLHPLERDAFRQLQTALK